VDDMGKIIRSGTGAGIVIPGGRYSTGTYLVALIVEFGRYCYNL
jgi:hypothetical protein